MDISMKDWVSISDVQLKKFRFGIPHQIYIYISDSKMFYVRLLSTSLDLKTWST